MSQQLPYLVHPSPALGTQTVNAFLPRTVTGFSGGCPPTVHPLLRFLVQSLSRVRLFETPWTAAPQASLSITNSRSLLKLMCTEVVMPSNHLILCCLLLLLPSVLPSIKVFSAEGISFLFRGPRKCPWSGLREGSPTMLWLSHQPGDGLVCPTLPAPDQGEPGRDQRNSES